MAGDQQQRYRLNRTVGDRVRMLGHTALGGTRALVLRRIAAVALLLLAAALAVLPAPGPTHGDVSVVTAAHDIAPGRALRADDVALRSVSAEVVPAGALTDPTAVRGRILAGAARSGEILTDVRVTGPALTHLAGGDGEHAAVPIPLSDLAVAGLIRPGRRVDVIAAGGSGPPDVLARNAAVLAVRAVDDGSDDRNHQIIVGLPTDEAAAVASASLTRSVTVTLR